ncbi:TetR/AcrR family transcriptional regulator [Agreia sp. Leaf283]|uniref:TetR/AcrR family transcriptional regulator n=1 Tax=Agreia sp. Leaf283 TaxID=1736321 RepID=UPI000A694407|nr:TetR/AcrR family transcriptional regulator [Agreia sp. Leaf283]
MTTKPILMDRRAELKARHREAILDAADSLILDRGQARFSVDELADRADIARRTVFNHFSSLDDVIMTSCTRTLNRAIDDFLAVASVTPSSHGSRAALFAEVTTAIQHMDLPSLVAYFFGLLDGDDARTQNADSVFMRSTEGLTVELARRSGVDEFEVAILVSTLMNGISVVARHWMIESGGTLDAASRSVWDSLLDRFIGIVRDGYSAPS